MKQVSNRFKEEIKKFGKQLDCIITFDDNGEQVELTGNELNSTSLFYNGGIIKSVMKTLEIESKVDIPLNKNINYKFGVLVDDEYEYINYGNFVVFSSEKQEDTNDYKIICYDSLINSMKDYNGVDITFPCSIRDYLLAICNKINIQSEIPETFPNNSKTIGSDVYLGIGYTYRDVLDELAQVTASTICLNDDDKLELRYVDKINSVGAVDEDSLKDTNVNFGEKYGKINSIVLSRAAGSDNVYLRDEMSISENGLCELKISDNQIMNGNDRSDYLADILHQLDGLEYYLNDFSSPGICYLDLCDRYDIQIGDNVYSCVMFNDEINFSNGLEETIFTDMPEETETDYSKSDKTDKRINQTYLMVDKQNQTIDGVITQVDSQNEKIASMTLSINELNTKISSIADITISGETSFATLNLESVNASQPIMIKIFPTSQNISYLYPRNNLYPNNNLYSTDRKIEFFNTTTNEKFYYKIPTDLLFYNSNIKDILTLSYDSNNVVVEKYCAYDGNGDVVVLDEPYTLNFDFPNDLYLTDGNYQISILGYNNGYLNVRLMASNIYTTQFATKVEMKSEIDQKANQIQLSVSENYATRNDLSNAETQLNSTITQTASNINSTVSQKVGKNEVISTINQSAEAITINANKVNLQGYVTLSGLSGAGQTTINGSNITTGTISTDRLQSNVITTGNLSSQSISANQITSGSLSANRISGGTINASNINVTNLNASNINRGSLSGIGYSYTTGNNAKVSISNNGDEPLMGYRGSSPRWSLAAFTNGGRFQTFDANGNMAAYFSHQGASKVISDRKDKDNIKSISETKSLSIINELNPVEYTYKKYLEEEEIYHRGLIAQEVKNALEKNGIKNQVYEINKEGRYSLSYIELIPDLINCIKNLTKRIEELENKENK